MILYLVFGITNDVASADAAAAVVARVISDLPASFHWRLLPQTQAISSSSIAQLRCREKTGEGREAVMGIQLPCSDPVPRRTGLG